LSYSEFVGWIPNVGGRLSFSHIGQADHPKRCVGLNESDSNGRVVFCAQERPLSDALVSSRYVEFVYGFDAKWMFVLFAKSEAVAGDRLGRLVGTVYVFTRRRWFSTDLGQSPAEWFDSTLYDLEKGAHSSADLAAATRAHEDAISSALSARAVYAVDCIIQRSGETQVSPRELAAEVLFTPAITTEAHQPDGRDVQYLANQAFMFLKDIAHNHRHHSKKQDTITLAHPKDDEFGWLRDTQYSIHRRVVVKRRAGNPKSLYEALGLMSYMASVSKLANSLAKTHTDAAGISIATSYNLKETEDSIKATLESRRWSRVQWNIVITAIPALLVSLGSLLRPAEGDTDGTIFGWVKSILSAFLAADLYGVLFLLVCLAVVPQLYGAVILSRLPGVDRVKRILVLLKQEDQANGLAIIGLALLLYSIAATASVIISPALDLRALSLIVLLIVLAVTAAFIAAVPYIPTLPDLAKSLRSRFAAASKR
jgi:hypothetical protein